MSALVHPSRPHKLTLSEVPARADAPRPQVVHTDRPQDITPAPGSHARIALAIAAHLSTRAAPSVADALAPGALALRSSYLLDALDKAARCPLCGPELSRG